MANQGIYHPTYNPNGSKKLSDGNFWYNTTIPIASMMDCFDSSKMLIASGSIGTISGRPDGLFYDQVHEGDILDLRNSSKKVEDYNRLISREFNKLVAGTYRGKEAEITTIAIRSFTKSSKFGINGNRFYFGITGTSYPEIALAPEYSLEFTLVGSNGSVYNTKQVLNIPNVGTMYIPLAGNTQVYIPIDGKNTDSSMNTLFPDGTTITVLVSKRTTRTTRTKSNTLLHCDIIGNPANYPTSWKQSGVFGTPLIVAEDGTSLLPDGVIRDFKLSRKANANPLQVLKSVDSGVSWSELKMASGLGQTSRIWLGMTTLGTDVYACVEGGDIYKQTNGTGNFIALGQTSRIWTGMTTIGTDVYACVYGGDIYKQTNGTGNFIALGQTTRNWRGMTTLGTDVYACVNGGDIYKQTNGTGNFIALGQTTRSWFGMTTLGTDVYACVNGGDIYKQTNGTGNFIALGQTSRIWFGMTTLGTDVYACVYGGDIYKQTNGTGNFIALGQTTRNWLIMTTLGTDVYACVNGGDIYKLPKENFGFNALENKITFSSTLASNDIIMSSYQTKTSMATHTASGEVLEIGKALGTNVVSNGALISTLIGKVPTANTSPYLQDGYNANAYRIDASTLKFSTTSTEIPTHAALSLGGGAVGVPAVKVLPYLTRTNGKAYLNLVFKEMKHNGTSWGDDSKFNIVNNVSTTLDDNGQTVLIGQKTVELPYFIGADE